MSAPDPVESSAPPQADLPAVVVLPEPAFTPFIPPRLTWLPLLGELLTALVLGLMVAVNFSANMWRVQYALNSDGIMYVRRAKYLLEGDFWNSISGYWSAGPIWSIAAMAWLTDLRSDTELLLAARYVLGVWAVLFTLAAYAFLWRLGIPWILRTVMSLMAAAIAVTWAMGQVVPELLLSAFLLAFWTMALSPKLLTSLWRAAVLGLIGGAMFLGKNVGLPYAMVLLPAWVLVRWWFERRGVEGVEDRPTLWQAARTWLIASAVVLLVAAPWIGVLSWRYGELTVATNGPVNHLLVAPAKYQAKHLDAKAFSTVPPPYVHSFELVDWLPRTPWGPGDPKFFEHTLAVAPSHIGKTFTVLQELDYADFGVLSLFLCAVLGTGVAFAKEDASPITRRLGRDAALLVLLLVVYACAFLFVFFNRRFYLVPMLVPIMGMSAVLLSLLLNGRGWQKWAGRVAWVILSYAVVSSFWANLGPQWQHRMTDARPRDDHFLASVMKEMNLRGPLIMADIFSNKGIYLSHLTGLPAVGFPIDEKDPARLQAEVDAAGAKVALVWIRKEHDERAVVGQAPLVEMLQRPEWERERIVWLTGDRSRGVQIWLRTAVPPADDLPTIYRIEPRKKD